VGMRQRRTPNPFTRVSGHYDDHRVSSGDAELDNAMFGTDPAGVHPSSRMHSGSQGDNFPQTQRVMVNMMKRMGH
jgi:hypothetical protein